MKTTITLLLAAATLTACGADKPGSAAQSFNKERAIVDARTSANLGTRMVKASKLPNGGYVSLPGATKSTGAIVGAGAKADAQGRDAEADGAGETGESAKDGAAGSKATEGRGYLVKPASETPGALDPVREAALRRGTPGRVDDLKARLAAAEMRRKKVIAAQDKKAADAKTGRRQAIRKADERAFKRYKLPTSVKLAPAKGSGGAKQTPGKQAPGKQAPGKQTPGKQSSPGKPTQATKGASPAGRATGTPQPR